MPCCRPVRFCNTHVRLQRAGCLNIAASKPQDYVSSLTPVAQGNVQQRPGQSELSATLQEARHMVAEPGGEAAIRPLTSVEPRAEAVAGAAEHDDVQTQPQQLSSRSNLTEVRIRVALAVDGMVQCKAVDLCVS